MLPLLALLAAGGAGAAAGSGLLGAAGAGAAGVGAGTAGALGAGGIAAQSAFPSLLGGAPLAELGGGQDILKQLDALKATQQMQPKQNHFRPVGIPEIANLGLPSEAQQFIGGHPYLQPIWMNRR